MSIHGLSIPSESAGSLGYIPLALANNLNDFGLFVCQWA
jgi:hypothetical protein